MIRRVALAAGCLAALAGPAAGDLPVGLSGADPAAEERPGLPAERAQAPAGVSTRWRVRAGLGASTMRLGGLEHFGDASTDRITGYAAKTYGVAVESRDRHDINFSLVESLEASFQVDPLVSVAVKVATLSSQHGSVHTVAGGGATRFDDTWEFSGDMILVMGGAGFNLPLAERLRLNIGLFLGAGWATAHLEHRTEVLVGGIPTVYEGTARGEASTFVPEFTMELERELTESLAIGAGLGYRFGGFDTLESAYPSTLDPFFSTQPEFLGGWPVRNTNRAPLSADYGGLLLVLYLTARG